MLHVPTGTGTTPDDPTEPLLRVERLSVRFGSFYALDNVDLAIRPGEFVALAGENGAGKSTLIRCVAGDIAPTSGRVLLGGARIGSTPGAVSQCGVAVVWQDLALCDNLDIASNLLLGHEDAGLFRSPTRMHATARALLASLGIPLHDTTRLVGSLSGGQRQLLAVARAMHGRPRLLILDEPTTALGVTESAQVEELAASVRAHGTTVVLVSHSLDQMFRLADRIAVLRHGRLVADLPTAGSRPDDVVALITGQQTDSSARRQLSRLHGLADRLASADPSSSLALILSALGAALATDRLCIHLVEGSTLRVAGALGLPPSLMHAWATLPFGPAGGPAGLAAQSERPVVDSHVESSPAWEPWRGEAREAGLQSSWAAPVIGPTGLTAVITVFGTRAGHPSADDLELVTLYAGYVANVVERDRLLGEVTARNRVLETIQEVLETLAGPIPLHEGVVVVLQSLGAGLGADAVGLLDEHAALEQEGSWLVVDAAGTRVAPPEGFLAAATELTRADGRDGKAQGLERPEGSYLAVDFGAAGGAGTLLAHWAGRPLPANGGSLLEDAANSLRLARERQVSERARREAAALRRSQELQRDFLSRLSHELRTPLTAIGGYASSLMQPDVSWDGDSERRFLSRISAESGRLNRLVDDLLDFSAIESSTLRLHADWCELPLVIDAAVACVAPADPALVAVHCAPELPVVWADHDRLEQVFVNLLDNALRHNPPGTRIRIDAGLDAEPGGGIVVSVADDGAGVPAEVAPAIFQFPRHRRLTASSGAGLGLSIAKGIVEAHGGRIELVRHDRGTTFAIHLPVERVGLAPQEVEEPSHGEPSRV
jgi:signal transduction histidine kinase/ABC-type multidrug transport system ATPase subunit